MTSMLELRRILPLLEKSINEVSLEDSLKYLKIYQALEVSESCLKGLKLKLGLSFERLLPNRTR